MTVNVRPAEFLAGHDIHQGRTCAASGHNDAAAPPSRVMNSRRFDSIGFPVRHAKYRIGEDQSAGIRSISQPARLWPRPRKGRGGGVGRGGRASGSPLTADAPLHCGELTKWARRRLSHCKKRHHDLITSSARVSSASGTIRPSALAVLRLPGTEYFWCRSRFD